MNIDDWLETAAVLAERPGFVTTASKNRAEASRFLGISDPYLVMKSHELAEFLAAGNSFAEYERWARQDAADLKRIKDTTYGWAFAIMAAITIGLFVVVAASGGS